jgi:hypothetical protein
MGPRLVSGAFMEVEERGFFERELPIFSYTEDYRQ